MQDQIFAAVLLELKYRMNVTLQMYRFNSLKKCLLDYEDSDS
jgi:hypothetical protein